MSEQRFSICLDLRKRREKTVLPVTEMDLLSDTEKILQTMKKECVDLNSWFYIILFYYSKEDFVNFKKFSDELVKTDVEQNPFYKDQKQLFIYILNILSFFYSFIAQKTKEKEKYDSYSTLSTSLVNQAEKITTYDPMTMICKGFLFFTQGDYDNSDMYFSNISENTNNLPSNIVILAKLGRALNAYNQTNYAKGIEFFVSLMKDYDYINENILESLGICYYNLNKIKKAKEIFMKILENYPNNTKVKAYLSIIDISDIDNDNFEEAFHRLIEAYQSDILNLPVLLINLCTMLLLAGQYTQAGEICNRLKLQLDYGEMKFNANDSRKDSTKFRKDLAEIKSAIYAINAKYQLCMNNPDEAFSLFLNSVQCNSKNIEAQFGLGQINLSMQNLSEAEKCFEICKTVLDENKKVSFKVLKYLAYIQSKTKRKEIDKTIQMYKTAIETKEDDIDCHIELAELLNLKKPEESLVYYKTAVKLIKENMTREDEMEIDTSTLYTKDIFPEVLNNIGCILIRMERYDEAEKYLVEAKELIKEELKKNNKKDFVRLQSIKLGIEFNFVIYYENKAQFDYAHMICKKIIQQNPYFIEAYVKLSELAKMRGHKSKANEYIKLAIEKNFITDDKEDNKKEVKDPNSSQSVKKLITLMNKPINPMIIQAYLFYENGREQDALQTLNQILKTYDDRDPYTLIFLGNIYYAMAIENRSKGVEKMTKAVELYFYALECDKYNVLAAIGLCNCLAEFNYADKALEIFKGITEVMENNHNAFINESLLYMNAKKWEKASIILNKVLKKIFNRKNQTIENLLCKCYIETKDFTKANHHLKNLMMKYPENMSYKFNYGLLLIAKSNEILSKTERKVSETQEAIAYIEKSIKLFETILTMKKEFYYYKCSEMISIWKLNLNTANIRLKEDKKREEEMTRKIEMNMMEYNKMIEAQNAKQKESEIDIEENEKLFEMTRTIAESMIKMPRAADLNKPEKKKKKQKREEEEFIEKEEKSAPEEEIFDEDKDKDNENVKEGEKKHKHKHKHRKHKHRKHKRDGDSNDADDNDGNENNDGNEDNKEERHERKKRKKLHKKRKIEEEDDDEDPFAFRGDGNTNKLVNDDAEDEPKIEEEEVDNNKRVSDQEQEDNNKMDIDENKDEDVEMNNE